MSDALEVLVDITHTSAKTIFFELECISVSCSCYLKKIIHETLFARTDFFDHVRSYLQAGSQMSDVGIHSVRYQNLNYKVLLTYTIYLPLSELLVLPAVDGSGWS